MTFDLPARIRQHMQNRTRAMLILVADDVKADPKQVAYAIQHMADLNLEPLTGEITHTPRDDVSGVPI